ncbi:hypothetical protein CPB85DRAFT_247997 [Mucidula mucida]|nr:hypothetical protein CPB85DRAFT_247997 [Mucidula mucida]
MHDSIDGTREIDAHLVSETETPWRDDIQKYLRGRWVRKKSRKKDAETKRIRLNGTGKYTVRPVGRVFVANEQALLLGMVV